MVIFNIAPRQWGKTYKCIETFLYMFNIGLNPMMLVSSSMEKNEIIRNHPLLEDFNKNHSSLIQSPTNTVLRGVRPNYLIIDDYTKLDQDKKEQIYHLYKMGKTKILIWTSPGEDYNKVTIMNLRDSKKKGVFTHNNPLSYDLITELSTNVFLYSRRNVEFNPNDWLIEYKNWFHGVKELFDFDIDIEKIYNIVNINGTVLSS